MSGCNATVERIGETARCGHRTAPHDGLHEDYLDGVVVLWHDRCKGAKPHTPPRYWMHEGAAGSDWVVAADGHGMVAHFTGSHPDPLGAAEAEAARLNGEDDGEWLHIYCRAAERAREHERDRAREALSIAQDQVAEFLSERDAFRAALEQIVEESCSDECTEQSHNVLLIAREALEGGR